MHSKKVLAHLRTISSTGLLVYCEALDVVALLSAVVEGANPEHYESIFEEFRRSCQTTSATQGFGLGLAIAHRAVEFHQGVIVPLGTSKAVCPSPQTCHRNR